MKIIVLALLVVAVIDSTFAIGSKCHSGVYDLHTPTLCSGVSGSLIRDSSDQYCCSFSDLQYLAGAKTNFELACIGDGGSYLDC